MGGDGSTQRVSACLSVVSTSSLTDDHRNYDEAIRLMQRATASPRKPNQIDYHDDNVPSQVRLFKSLKLWSFYVDLEESIGSVETTKKVYDKIFELKIANAQVVINYANFLEENDYFEESFKIYERGISLFGFPIAFELWNIYLIKFTKRYGGSKVERTRDLFEQALEECPEKFVKPIFLLYGQFEEDHGMARRAMNVYNRATEKVESKDKFEVRAAAMIAEGRLTRRSRRCSRSSLERRQPTTVCLLPAQCMKRLSRRCPTNTLPRCACVSHLSSASWGRSIVRALSMRTARNSATLVYRPSSGRNGTRLKWRLDRKTLSERCCESSEPFKHQ